MPWRGDVDRWRPKPPRTSPPGSQTGHLPPLGRLAQVVGRVGWRRRRLARPRAAQGGSESKAAALPPAPHRVRTPRTDLHQARPDHLRRRRPVPGRARRRVQAAARPGAARAVRRRAHGRRGGARPLARRRVRALRSHADRRGVDRPGARGAAAHRRGGRRQGAATRRSPSSCARTSKRCRGSRRGSSAASRSPRSRTRPRSSSCSRRRSSRSSTSGSRRENMLDIARVLAETGQRALIVPRPHPDARDATRARDGTARRHPVGRRRRDARRRRRHRGGLARRARRRSWKARCSTASSTATCTAATSMVQPDGRTVLMDFGITGRLDETKRHGVPDAARRRDERRHDGPAPRARAISARSRPTPTSTRCSAISVSTSTVDPTTLSADELVARAPGAHEEAARVRCARAEGAHAVREEHDVPRRRDRAPRARPRHPRGGRSRCTPRSRCATAQRLAADLGIDPDARRQFDMDSIKAAMGSRPTSSASPTATCSSAARSSASASRRSAAANELELA